MGLKSTADWNVIEFSVKVEPRTGRGHAKHKEEDYMNEWSPIWLYVETTALATNTASVVLDIEK